MKRIIKSHQPSSLIQWFRGQDKINCSFEYGMTTALKNEVKQSLLDEQGCLCCYTGKRIDLKTSHIEHLKPQALSRRNREQGIEDYDDVSYENMLAAYPKELFEKDKTTGVEKRVKCGFGAVAREDIKLPVTPLQENCEQRFSFDAFGKIHAADADADETIKVLKLTHEHLKDGRKAVIDGILLADGLTETQVKRAAETAMERDGENRFKQFCFVLKMACNLRLKKIERKRQNQKFIQQSKKRK